MAKSILNSTFLESLQDENKTFIFSNLAKKLLKPVIELKCYENHIIFRLKHVAKML